MNSADLLRAFASPSLPQANRAFRLHWGSAQSSLEQVLIAHRIDISEGLCSGIVGHVTCLSTRADLPLNAFIGLPLSVQMVTDRGALHPICAIVTDARAGQSDGSLATYQLTMRDALSVLEGRTNTRIFRTLSVPDVIEKLLGEWQKKSPALARAFDFDLSSLDRAKYPVRETLLQFHESDADFIRRLCRREGIAWFTAAGKRGAAPSADGAGESPVHTLVLLDDPMKLPKSSAGTVRYHRDAATEARDSITLWSASRQLVPGNVQRASWDYKSATVAQASETSIVDQGEAGNDLAQLLRDAVIDVPHAGDSWSDYERVSKARMLAHELRSANVDAVSGVRDLAVGRWFELTGHPEVDTHPQEERQFIVTTLHHRGENSLPKTLNERAQALFEANRWRVEGPSKVAASASSAGQGRAASSADEEESRYENTFSCVRRGVPLTPAYDPRIDLPRVYPITALVVGPQGEEVYCDSLGRIKVQLQGLDPDDHAHAQGAGTSGTDKDSAFVRVSSSWAGTNYGHDTLPRIGMEVALDFLNGDPDKMFVTGVLHNGPNMPATFSHTGALPGNRFLSGVKTKEIKGARYNQLRFDDTAGEISSQLASEHTYSQLNLGYLTQPRDNGTGEARGEGAELRSDANVAIRSGKAMLISAWQRLNAKDGQLARDEYLQLMQECVELFKSLGDYAAQHQGVAMDTQPQTDLATAVKSWSDGKTSSGSGDASSQAVVGVTAPAGISMATPKTVATYAGGNVDTVAQNHLQLTGGQRVNVNAGQGVSLFAHLNGVSAIANLGKVRLQSQADDTQIDSAKNIMLTAAGGKLSGMASDQVVLVTSGGAYLKLQGANIELGCPGSFTVKAAGHTWAGPASMSADMPKFDNAPLGRVPKLVRATDGQAVTGIDAEVQKAAGDVVKGQTDAAGKLSPISSDQFQQLAVKFFKKPT
ncbi:type VI secretion system Vgr family protein [Paraburkholderia aspalathi]|uniref:type VI secretion system Vgr family protein n=1 Tax=Paraburkholderia aspalathi TaxID=1324617 RepID=UPI001B023139|nr:type VI secretion system tip protein VgrG [Paraburkholderia aspalathi]CAE6819842.1 hypothetical protein R20943_06106 [Paraburkholderia aspalathi]